MSFLSVTGRDINQDMLINTPSPTTPSKSGTRYKVSSRILEEQESQEFQDSNTLTEEKSKNENFERITERVSYTIHELKAIYNQIGYSSTETAIKSTEIFSVIEDTIAQFTANLQREKSNIENECEWLRQQIRIILAMIDDNNGEKTLSLSRQGLVFGDESKYELGFKEELNNKIEQIELKKHCFYASSPFNITSTVDSKSNSHQQQYDCMLNNVPKLSLLQQKNALNKIFLFVLNKFIEIFGKFNELNLIRHEILEIIGPSIYNTNDPFSSSLPSKLEAEEFRGLIEKFSKIVNTLKPLENEFDFQLGQNSAFVVSSPRKNVTKKNDEIIGSEPEAASLTILRDVNYKLIRAIRGLKITKISDAVIDQLQEVVENAEMELNSRMSAMHETIEQCFQLIEILHLNDEQFINIQKKFDVNKDEHSNQTECIDCETLRFIQKNPKEFGLSDKHFDYLKSIIDILTKIKENKQNRWDFYHTACVPLWQKLGESEDFVVNFIQLNSSLTDISISNFKQEYGRLCKKRSEYVDSFIADTRTEIFRLWDMLRMSRSQRLNFKYFDYDSHSKLDKELVLHEHEEELKLLQEEYKAKEEILKLNGNLDELLADQTFLRESSKDSSRLLSKNSCKILLNEEKIRKRLIKLLPSTIKQLKAAVICYNNEQSDNGKSPMTVDGEDLLERIIAIETEFNSNSKKPRSSLRSKVVSPNKVSKTVSNKSSPTISKTSIKSSPLHSEKNAPFKAKAPLSNNTSLNIGYKPKDNSPPKKNFATKLIPLNAPLTVNNGTPSLLRGGNIVDTSNISEASSSSKQSPSKLFSFQHSPSKSISEEKENTFALSPIKASDFIFETNKQTNKEQNNDLTSYNSSTIISDDYQMWRNEKIKQLNRIIK